MNKVSSVSWKMQFWRRGKALQNRSLLYVTIIVIFLYYNGTIITSPWISNSKNVRQYTIATLIEQKTESATNTFIASIHKSSNSRIAICHHATSIEVQSILMFMENVHLFDLRSVRKFRILSETNSALVDCCIETVTLAFPFDVFYIDIRYDPSFMLSNDALAKVLFDSGWKAEDEKGVIGKAVSFESCFPATRTTEDIIFSPKKLTQRADSKCYIRRKSQKLYPVVEKRFDPSILAKELRTSSDKRVALGIPVNSRGITRIDDLPLLKYLWPSFINTAKHDPGITYIMLIAVDRSDTFLMSEEHRSIVKSRVESSRGDVIVEFVVFDDSDGWVVYLWNGLFDLGIHYFGAHFFFQINDDFIFLTSDWAQECISKLQGSHYHFVGVTGPVDIKNDATLTASFVSVEHFLIFGFYYPYSFTNWYSDDWIQLIYQGRGLKFNTEQKILNSNYGGTRYYPCKNHAIILQQELKLNWLKIPTYLKQQGYSLSLPHSKRKLEGQLT